MAAGPAVRGSTAVLAVTCLSSLVVNANTSAVGILLPAISRDVGMPVSTLQWAVTGYSLVGAAVIVTSGALGDIYGRRRLFIGGLLLFVASCLLIALTDTGAGVIGGRAIQGAAGSTILACGLSLLTVGTPDSERMKAISLWGASAAVGAAVGPLVGGVLVDITGWQGLFWIDAAIAAVCVPLTLARVGESRDPNRSRSIDVVGTVLIAAILAPFIFGVTEGSTWGWASPRTIGCLLISVLAGIAFVMVERRAQAPLLDLALLRNSVLVGATVAILIGAGAINGVAYVLSLYFQDPATLGMSPLQAGLAMLPMTVGLVAIATPTASLVVHFRARNVIAGGFVLTAAGYLWLGLVEQSWTYAYFVLPLLLIAVGMGLSNGPSSSLSTTAVAPEQVGAASGVSNMARYVGAAVATAIVASVYDGVSSSAKASGAEAGDALASALSRATIPLLIASLGGIALALLVARHRATPPRASDFAAAAASTQHAISTR